MTCVVNSLSPPKVAHSWGRLVRSGFIAAVTCVLPMMAGVLNRMLKRALSGGWEKWQQTYADLKFANRSGGGAIRRMLNRKLSMAFEKWQFTAAEMARQQFMLQGALNRMVKRAMAGAWEKWQQTYVDLKYANRAGGGAIQRTPVLRGLAS